MRMVDRPLTPSLRDDVVEYAAQVLDEMLDIIHVVANDAFWSEQWRGRKWTVNLKAATSRKRLAFSTETSNRRTPGSRLG
jgi:hypothetical protein